MELGPLEETVGIKGVSTRLRFEAPFTGGGSQMGASSP